MRASTNHTFAIRRCKCAYITCKDVTHLKSTHGVHTVALRAYMHKFNFSYPILSFFYFSLMWRCVRACTNFYFFLFSLVFFSSVAPTTAHSAFDKGCQYFGIKLVSVPVRTSDNSYAADVQAMRSAINRNTIALVGSATNFPHGKHTHYAFQSEHHRACGLRNKLLVYANTVGTHARTQTRTHARTRANAHARAHTRTHARKHALTHVHTQARMHVRKYTRTHARTAKCRLALILPHRCS